VACCKLASTEISQRPTDEKTESKNMKRPILILIHIGLFGSLCMAQTVGKQYLENDNIKIGIDLDSGGGIFYLSQKSPERNLLRAYPRTPPVRSATMAN
jgi:hypothetical protein